MAQEQGQEIETLLGRIEKLLVVRFKEEMDADECANYIGIERTTLYNKCNKREIPHYRKGNKLMFKKSEISEWMLGERVPMIDKEGYADNFCVQRRVSEKSKNNLKRTNKCI